jgi:hypothetical protein
MSAELSCALVSICSARKTCCAKKHCTLRSSWMYEKCFYSFLSSSPLSHKAVFVVWSRVVAKWKHLFSPAALSSVPSSRSRVVALCDHQHYLHARAKTRIYQQPNAVYLASATHNPNRVVARWSIERMRDAITPDWRRRLRGFALLQWPRAERSNFQKHDNIITSIHCNTTSLRVSFWTYGRANLHVITSVLW